MALFPFSKDIKMTQLSRYTKFISLILLQYPIKLLSVALLLSIATNFNCSPAWATEDNIVPAIAVPLVSQPESLKIKPGRNTEPVISIKNDATNVSTPKTTTTTHPDDTGEFALPDDLEDGKNEFQKFITESIGHPLSVFGRNLFTSRKSSFAPSQDIAVPNDYVIGIGDELHIRATGSIDINYQATVDRNGTISLPRVGSFRVAGLHYADIQTVIQHEIGRYFKDFTLYVSLGQLRSIRVYMVGHVKHPGAYTVSSLSTLVNALLNAGGPSATGSLRNIQVKRAGRLITDFDLYDLLLKGDKSKDIRLLSEDVIYVAPIGKLIGLNGSVNEPSIYEVRNNETLSDVLSFAGGISTVAAIDTVSIERIINRKQRTAKQIHLNSNSLKQSVNDGDLITVYPISHKFESIVTLRGHVFTPLRIQWKQGMRISDVIPSKETLVTPDYYSKIEHYAPASPEKPLDTSTAIRPLFKEPNWEYAVVERLRNDLSHEIIPFNLSKALIGDEKNNLVLNENDIITIFSSNDIHVPRSQKSGFVQLEGEFQASGTYRLKPNETLRQLIERVGGITSDANLYAIEVNRESTRKQQIERYNQWLSHLEIDLLRKNNNHTSLSSESAALQLNENEKRQKLIDSLKSVQPTGRIVLNFKDNYTPQIPDLPDFILEDGDRIALPPRSATVSMVGAVLNNGNFLYRPEKSISDYLDEAGGATESADDSNLYVIRADGSIANSKHSLSWLHIGRLSVAVQPGDTIVIPEKIDGPNIISTLKDFATIFYQFGLGAAAIHVLKN